MQVGDDTIVGKNVILATGSYSRSLPGLEIGGRVITTEQALELDFVPKKVVVLGGGVIGVEFASVWKSFGAEVTDRRGAAAPGPQRGRVDQQVVRARVPQARHRLPPRRPLLRRHAERERRRRHARRRQTFEAELLLVAVGRGPLTADIGYDEVGVTLDRGFVITDERLQTNIPGVYAVGDIVPGLQLAHRGFQQGIFVAEEIAGLNPIVVPDVNIPKVTYCDPEVASVGLTEAKAVEQYGADKVTSYDYNLAGNGKSEIIGTSGSVKVVRVNDGPVVGVHMIGARVGELIGEAQLAVNWEAYPEDIAPFVHAHPTQNEALGEAFLALAGKPLHTL